MSAGAASRNPHSSSTSPVSSTSIPAATLASIAGPGRGLESLAHGGSHSRQDALADVGVGSSSAAQAVSDRHPLNLSGHSDMY
eukprot:841532-Rhodomonas_salina.3